MRHAWLLNVLLLAGCSTHPLVDIMDFTHPGKMYRDDVPPYGGVCANQGAVLAPGPTVCPPPPPPGPEIVPPAVPLPGNRGVSPPPPNFPAMSPAPF